ncbi:hypothetical protein C1N84_22875 (plasmid) [Pantoea sp. SGAir0418]
MEHIFSRDHLKDEADTLIKREQSQRSLLKLTHIYSHQLQDFAVQFAANWNVRTSYLSLWRT